MCHLDEFELVIELIVLLMSNFDILLGTDWLSSYHISIGTVKFASVRWVRDEYSNLSGQPFCGVISGVHRGGDATGIEY